MLFRNRTEAGKLLATALAQYADDPDVVVLALPRGGVPVGFEVANRLGVPLDVFVVRKLGVPNHKELAFGAIATGGARVHNYRVLRHVEIPDDVIEAIEAEERSELQRRERLYRGDRPPVHVMGRTVILVDDGLATGSTMLAAVSALRSQRAGRIVVAVPVGSALSCNELRPEVDELVCLVEPEPFYSVGQWYAEFPQITDSDVSDLLGRTAPQLVH